VHDAARKRVAVELVHLVCLTVDHQRLHAPEHDPELLVGMRVGGHRGARLEGHEVQHGSLAEQRVALDAVDHRERRGGGEVEHLNLHGS
jgi:hypothetical protein